MRYSKIPDETVRRLPIYLRGLLFSLEEGRGSISSQDLGELVMVKPWQIRKDFSYFGGFGTRGRGYEITKLIKQIKKILKLDVVRKAALVGVGNLGSAVLAHEDFKTYGFDIAAAFDNSPDKIGKKVNNVTIEDTVKLASLKRHKIDLGIIAVPRKAAQETADALVEVGVKGILNFSPCFITVPKRIKVITIDFAKDLARLPYYMPKS